MIQLPASEDCYGLKVMSGKETRYPKEKCVQMVKRSIMLTSANWNMVRQDIQKNCMYNDCHQITGPVDGLFLMIDKKLQQVPLR
jgi:hypothetical protein